MSPAIPSTSLNQILTQVHSRRLLLHTPLLEPGTPSTSPASSPILSDSGSLPMTAPGNGFDSNVIMILAVLFCALICALGINSIVRFALRCSSRIEFEPEPGQEARLAASGVRRKAVRAIPVMICSPNLKFHGSGSECAICLSDLMPGERVRVLPKCNHGFHVRCIDRWLMARPSCPTCRQCLFATVQKSSGCGEASQMDPGTVRSFIVPLEPEGFVHNYRGVS